LLSLGLPSIHQAIDVRYRYSVHFTADMFAPQNTLFRDILDQDGGDGPKQILCVVDRMVSRHHPNLVVSIDRYCQAHNLVLVAPPQVTDGDERVKNDPEQVIRLHRLIYELGLDRHSYVMAIGSGALLDMVGYAAATAHRGLRLIRVPTTVLSQADSGVGVKNGVNAFGTKNFVGTFAPPFAVVNDSNFLRTLPDREWRTGIAEAIKVALLKDPCFFTFLEAKAQRLLWRDMEAMQRVVYRCAQLHLEHIATSGDPFEFGSSRPLDFGHWAAHKLEQLSDYQLRHGEAVAVGLALDSTYSYLADLLSEDEWQRILRLISALGLAVYVPELGAHLADRGGRCCVLGGLDEFRQHLGGRLTIMLLEGIGRGIEVHQLDEDRIVRGIALLREYQAALGQGDAHGAVSERVFADPAAVG